MKRTGNLFDEIVEWKNLRLAAYKALRGKRTRLDARQFVSQFDSRLKQMADQLRDASFPLGRYHQFVIYDPKRRTITAPCFAERVLHHAIMNVCEPVFEQHLIHDTYACRAGRGREAAIQRAQRFAHRFPSYLKLDIRKYFESVPRDRLLAGLERLFKDERVLELFASILYSFLPGHRRGLPIGSLTSQHFANFYLGRFDRFVKERLRLKGYVRYMDDMLLWGANPRTMRAIQTLCEDFVGEELELEFKPHPYVNLSCHGVDFLGCRVMPDHVLLSRRSRVRFARKMAKLERAYLAGQVDELELQARSTSLFAFTQAAGARSWHFRCRVLKQLPVSGRRPRTG
jgi:retron-type reverse transcriptase